MRANCLQINTAKTEIIWFATCRRRHQLPSIGLEVGNDIVIPSKSVRDLGVYRDSDLTIKTHVNRTVSACFYALRQLRSVRRSVPSDVFQLMVVSLVLT